jgi:hypothetical protein
VGLNQQLSSYRPTSYLEVTLAPQTHAWPHAHTHTGSTTCCVCVSVTSSHCPQKRSVAKACRMLPSQNTLCILKNIFCSYFPAAQAIFSLGKLKFGSRSLFSFISDWSTVLILTGVGTTDGFLQLSVCFHSTRDDLQFFPMSLFISHFKRTALG